MQYISYARKAILTALAVVLTNLVTILTGDQNLADVTFVQWLWIALSVLGAFGVTYVVPNGPKPTGAHVAE